MMIDDDDDDDDDDDVFCLLLGLVNSGCFLLFKGFFCL